MALALEPAPGPLLAATLDLLGHHPGLSVPPPENLHLTLAFLGELDTGQVAEAAEAVRAATVGRSTWDVSWGQGGAFPTLQRPRVLWLGLADEAATREMQARLSAELARRGFRGEDRPFRPHLTLARVRRGITPGSLLALEGELAAIVVPPPAAVRGLLLYESRAGRQSPTYVPVASASLL